MVNLEHFPIIDTSLNPVGHITVTHRVPIEEIWKILAEEGEDPNTLVRWFAGKKTNPLAELGSQQGISKESFYVQTDAPLEVGYIWFPSKPDGSNQNDNMADRNATLHKHMKCVEGFYVINGRIDLLVGVPSQTSRIKGIDSVSERYNWSEGQLLSLDANDPETDSFFIVPPDSYHIITHVKPDTKLLLVKSTTPNWDGVSDWTGTSIHPCEANIR